MAATLAEVKAALAGMYTTSGEIDTNAALLLTAINAGTQGAAGAQGAQGAAGAQGAQGAQGAAG